MHSDFEGKRVEFLDLMFAQEPDQAEIVAFVLEVVGMFVVFAKGLAVEFAVGLAVAVVAAAVLGLAFSAEEVCSKTPSQQACFDL